MLATAGAVLAIDQATKAVLVAALDPGEHRDLVLGIDLVRVSNEGIAFGLLEDGGGVVLAITAISLALVIGWFATAPRRPLLWLGVGLMLGGACGNLLDRIRESAVTDFVDPPLWPAFNFADVGITFGVAVILLSALSTGEARERRSS
jgi:signal peptidase II